jgi:allantoinase
MQTTHGSMMELIVRGGTVVTPHGSFEGDIVVRDGRIAAIGQRLEAGPSTPTLDARGLVVLPGVIDPHSHLWEAGFVSGPDFTDSSASAAVGGITTIIEMPLTVPEVLDETVLLDKARLGERTSHVDFALYGGVSPDRLDDLEGIWRAGAAAFKIFTCDTGCAMKGVIDDADLVEAMSRIARLGALACFHAENDELLVANRRRLAALGRRDNAAFCDWHSETAELEAINRILFYAGRLGTRVHIVHVTSPEGLKLVARARREGVRATAETCPHYLYLTEDDIAARGAWVTCAPPMRGVGAKAGLRASLDDGSIATIGSDHGPVDPELKQRASNDVFAGQCGMPANETMVPLMLNLATEGFISLERLAALLAEAPARLYGLYPRKGAIAIGSDADFTIVDPAERWTIRQADLIGACGWTPFEDVTVTGRVKMTVVRGRLVARDGRLAGEPGAAYIPRLA